MFSTKTGMWSIFFSKNDLGYRDVRIDLHIEHTSRGGLCRVDFLGQKNSKHAISEGCLGSKRFADGTFDGKGKMKVGTRTYCHKGATIQT